MSGDVSFSLRIPLPKPQQGRSFIKIIVNIRRRGSQLVKYKIIYTGNLKAFSHLEK